MSLDALLRRLVDARVSTDSFKDYDVPHRKKVNAWAARKVLGHLDVVATPAELAALEAAYGDADGDVNYKRLVEDAYAVGVLPSYHATSGDSLQPAAAAALHAVLDSLRHLVATRGVIIKLGMKNYDKLGRGVVTATQFAREMSTAFPSLSPADRALLVAAYATDATRDYVRYSDLHRDVSGEGEGERVLIVVLKMHTYL